jgi:hypothetical protein
MNEVVMTLDQCQDNNKWMDLSKIDPESITPLYSIDWYDGPLTGVCKYVGTRYYFNWVDDVGKNWIYVLVRLTPEQWELEDKRDTLFQEKVGTHCNYGGKGELSPKETWNEYYKAYPPDEQVPMYLNNEVIGWTTDEAF